MLGIQTIPLVVAYIFIALPYFPFVKTLAIDDSLHRGELFRGARQIIIYNILTFLTTLSLYIASSRSPGSPSREYVIAGRMVRDEEEKRRRWEEGVFRGTIEGERMDGSGDGEGEGEEEDDEDIPLSRIYRKTSQHESETMTLRNPSHDYSLSEILDQSPTKGFNSYPPRRSDVSSRHDQHVSDFSISHHSIHPSTIDESIFPLLASSDQLLPNTLQTLTRKSTTGQRRWCRKCDAPKPDRCHHCRQCGCCILKMDHHCVWLANCVGYQNHKPFLLFLIYASLLGLYVLIEAGGVVYRFFTDPGGDDEIIDIKPVLYLLLCMAGAGFSLPVGGFTLYHLYLVLNNRTTLESMMRSLPSAAIDVDSIRSHKSRTEDSRGSLDVTRPDHWRSDHELSRDERRRAHRAVEEINLYDMGWKKNLQSAFGGGRWWEFGWPGTRSGRNDPLAGHEFPVDREALEELKMETARVRLGVNMDDGEMYGEASSVDSDT